MVLSLFHTGSWAGRQAGRQAYIPALYQVRRTVVNDVGGSSYKYISILLGQYVSGMVVGLSSFELFTWCVCVCWSLFTSLFHLLSSTAGRLNTRTVHGTGS